MTNPESPRSPSATETKMSIEEYLELLPTLSADELTKLTVFHFQQLVRAIKEDR